MKFQIEVDMPDRWVSHFLGMLKEMQYLGDMGGSRNITFYADGDGDFRPKFSWPDNLAVAEPDSRDDLGNSFFDAG